MSLLFATETRRNPYPIYEQLRRVSPLLFDKESRLRFVFDYKTVKRILSDYEKFSSRLGPAEWMIFLDPPRHNHLRALVSQAFTPRSVGALEPRIRAMVREILGAANESFDLVQELSSPLPMLVITEMLGAPREDLPLFRRWNEVLLNMSQTLPGGEQAAERHNDFKAATQEMGDYVGRLLNQRKSAPQDDLLSRLAAAEIAGQRLSQTEILGFFQLLLLAGSETTTNLVSNAVLALLENPHELHRLRDRPELLPGAIEEVLRYLSPLQWMFRVATCDLELHGQAVPRGAVVLAVMGAANRDPLQFPEPDRFDITRSPNSHVAFGHGIHSCLGAALARLEASVVLEEFLRRAGRFELASSEPLEPYQGLHVLGPARLPLKIDWL